MRRRMIRGATLLLLIALAGSIGRGQTSTAVIDQIEEDWSLVIGAPNPDEAGPQITTCMSPVSDGSTPFVAFDLNYRDYPSFLSGGLQVKIYSNDTVTASASEEDDLLQTTGETITWTQRLSLTSSNTLTYQVVNGQSMTWGTFGQGQGLPSLTFTAQVSSLANYSPTTSVGNSGVGWQSNRVTQMVLTQVRYYSSGQLVATDTTSRPVNLSIAQ